MALVLGVTLPMGASAQTTAPELSAEEIIERLQEANRQRDDRLGGYEVSRRYALRGELYSRQPTTMDVEVSFRTPSELKIDTRAQQGSAFLAKRVFGRMIEGEKESVEPERKRASAMTPENYEFRLLGVEAVRGRAAYKLEVTPRREDTFLFQGRIWVDAGDFAVVRAEGRAVKRPSFFLRKIEFVRTFKKVGPFWFPDRTDSANEVLLFGTFWVAIENGNYRVRLRSEAGAR
ncbi:MAG: hypothetical protein HYY26_01485 [Acidobacteria bacterium]|nr:hypothetical protein [Acidobacteriota bacterium]